MGKDKKMDNSNKKRRMKKNPVPKKMQKYLKGDKEKKVLYDLGTKNFYGTTTFRNDYDHQNGKKSDMLKVADNLKNKNFQLTETTTGKHYNYHTQDPATRKNHGYNKNQRDFNKYFDRNGKVLKETVNHTDHYKKVTYTVHTVNKNVKMVSNESKLPKKTKIISWYNI